MYFRAGGIKSLVLRKWQKILRKVLLAAVYCYKASSDTLQLLSNRWTSAQNVWFIMALGVVCSEHGPEQSQAQTCFSTKPQKHLIALLVFTFPVHNRHQLLWFHSPVDDSTTSIVLAAQFATFQSANPYQPLFFSSMQLCQLELFNCFKYHVPFVNEAC